MANRDAFGDPFVHRRLVGRAQGVGAVTKGQFELARRVFRDRPFKGHVLNVGGGPQIAQIILVVSQFTQAVDAVLGRPFTGDRRARQFNPAAGGALLIDQIVFKFARHHRR